MTLDLPAAGPAVRAPVCVVGAGTMGRGIAQVALAHDHAVTLVDPDPGQLESAVSEIGRRLARRHPQIVDGLAERLRTVGRIQDAPPSSETVVIEAIVEDLEAKSGVFRDAVAHFGEGCLLATNTSSLSVTEIAASTSAPSRVVGMHFFNPVPAMRLVEVVAGLQTSAAAVERVAELARSWSKEVALVRSAPGFIVNRVARPFYGEALRLLEEGVSDVPTIDELLRTAGGFPMGPFQLMDLIGVDVNLRVTRKVWEAFDYDARFAPSRLQTELVAAGRLGRKTGHGFYSYARNEELPRPMAAPSSGAEPGDLILHGHSPDLVALVDRIGMSARAGDPDARAALELAGRGLVVITRGRTAQAESLAARAPVVVLDRCLDPASTPALAVSEGEESLLGAVVDLLDRAGIAAYVVADTPGLVVARIVSMIISEAAEAALHQVATPADIDRAMRLGTNYPLGPFAWAQRWTSAVVVDILDEIEAEYHSQRYRVSRQLRSQARAGR